MAVSGQIRTKCVQYPRATKWPLSTLISSGSEMKVEPVARSMRKSDTLARYPEGGCFLFQKMIFITSAELCLGPLRSDVHVSNETNECHLHLGGLHTSISVSLLFWEAGRASASSDSHFRAVTRRPLRSLPPSSVCVC